MSRTARLRLLLAGFAGMWLLLLGRSGWLQLVEHEKWLVRARDSQETAIELPAIRGRILSTDGVVIARSVPKPALAVDPRQVGNPERFAAVLDTLGILPAGDVRSRLTARPGSGFAWITRTLIPQERLERALALCPELDVVPESARLYPLGSAAGPIVGVVGQDDVALGGLEARFGTELAGLEGEMVRVGAAVDGAFDRLRVEVRRPASSGADLHTTLHSRVQEVAAARLEQGVLREGAVAGWVVVLRPQTGEVLGLASYPAVDPADPRTWQAENLRQRAIHDAFEPGSSFKVVAFAAALESGDLTPDDLIDCMNGRRAVPGGVITDHHPHGVLTAREVLGESSNIGTGIIAERTGRDWFYRMERAFGFGPQTGIDLPGEARGRILEPAAWSARSLQTQAFGQEISVTGIQLALAYGAIANGGLLMRPLVTRELRAPDGRVLQRWEPEVVRRVITEDTAATLRDMLRFVVTDGTGKKAEVLGYPTAGKTSTAQKYIADEGSYSNRRYLAGFVGFAPYDDPQIVCAVYLDEPSADIYGGSVAAPIFRDIVADLRSLLPGAGAPPAVAALVSPDSLQRGSVRLLHAPELAGLDVTVARRLVEEAGLLARLEGSGDRVHASRPAAGTPCEPGSVITLSLAGSVNDSLVVDRGTPDLRGLPLRDAILRLRSLDAPYHVRGSGWVVAQSPAPGEPLGTGESCLITLAPDSSRAWKEFLRGGGHASREAPRGDLVARAHE